MNVDASTFFLKCLAQPVSLCAFSELVDSGVFPEFGKAFFTCFLSILPYVGSLRYLVEVDHAPYRLAEAAAVDTDTRCVGMLPLCFRPARVPTPVIVSPFRFSCAFELLRSQRQQAQASN